MSNKKKIEKAVDLIVDQIDELYEILNIAKQDAEFKAAHERLKRWKERTVRLLIDNICEEEGQKLQEIVKTSFKGGQPLSNLADEVEMYHGFLLSLGEEIRNHPEDIFMSGRSKQLKTIKVPDPIGKRTVFIIHGHDELNTLRLEKVLKDRWHINPIILNSSPGKGRTLIEKFEQEAQKANYAVALFTPDDLIEMEDTKYLQARPNVIFELGWFYGRLGRQNVCILFKKGTNIHSDLDGIMRIEFNESILEKITEFEKELKAVNLV